MANIRLVVVDDHESVRDALRAVLTTDAGIDVVGEAADGREAIGRVAALHPDVLLMDITMPGMNGFEATKAVAESCPNTRVLVITRHAEPAYVRDFLRAGASGYVLKQSPVRELLRAVHSVADGRTYIDGTLAEEVNPPTDPLPRHSRPGVTLTPREEDVLRLASLGNSNKSIAATLGISVKTVEVHKAHAMLKLNLPSRHDVVRYAHMRGWLTSSKQEPDT
jgi:DNA-binding NarL/FixJ family response regulator